MTGWVILGIAIVCESIGTGFLKYATLTGKSIFYGFFGIFLVLSFVFLAKALKYLDVSIAYAVWAGVGIFLITCMGFIIFKDPFSWLKVLFLAFIVVGVVGLKLIS